MDRQSKKTRTLDMYDRLCEGKIIDKSIEAHNFGVDERSIQRDIDDFRAHLENKKSLHTGDGRTVEYSRSKKGFEMTGNVDSLMSNSEILAVSKILLESRAFTKKGGELKKPSSNINNCKHGNQSGTKDKRAHLHTYQSI